MAEELGERYEELNLVYATDDQVENFAKGQVALQTLVRNCCEYMDVGMTALLLPGKPFGELRDASLTRSFQPCLTCHRPCLESCPAHVYDGKGGADLQTCALHRHAGNCETGCEVRRACPVGAEHRFGPEEERHRHAYSLFTMRKHFGLGAWKFVPRGFRR